MSEHMAKDDMKTQLRDWTSRLESIQEEFDAAARHASERIAALKRELSDVSDRQDISKAKKDIEEAEGS